MQVWNVLHAARWKYRTQNIAKISPSGHHHATLSGNIFAIKACIDNRQKLLNSNIPSTSSHNVVNLGHYRLKSVSQFGAPSKFQRVSCLAFVTAATSLTGSQPNFARCLAVSCAGTLYILFGWLLPPDGILPGAKFTLRRSLALPYIGSVTARNSSSRREPNSAAWYKEWNYGTFAEGATYIQLGGHHVGHRPTF